MTNKAITTETHLLVLLTENKNEKYFF